MTKRATPIFLFFILLRLSVFSQAYTHVYYLNAELNSVNKDKAIIFGKGFYDSKLFKLDCFFAKTNDLLFSIHFSDSSIASLEGEFQEYHLGGKMKKKGYYNTDKKHGIWEEWDTLGRKTDSVFYQDGTRFKYAKMDYFTNPDKNSYGLYSYKITDSLADTFDETYYSDSGVLKGQVHFVGQTGIWKHYKDGVTTLDTVYTREEREAEFPGGNQAWARYLEKTLSSFNPADNGAKAGKYKVIVKFIVDKDGTISDVAAETKYGHKMESTVIKMIERGPKWIPASQFGRPVKAYRRQPVTFLVEVQ
jgi:antitoxin component YwqK of YwqJK toxin-antitoxin module